MGLRTLCSLCLGACALGILCFWPFSHKEPTSFPVTEEKPFVILIPSFNSALYVEKNLRSVFAQHYHNYRVVYIHDGSTDAGLSAVSRLLKELQGESRTTIVSHPTHHGVLASLYTEVHRLKDPEIVVWLSGNDFLAHEKVLSRLNEVYANPQIWFTLGGGLTYPHYTSPWPAPHIYTRKKEEALPPLPTFYAALFKQIKLESLVFRTHFFQVAAEQAVLFPLLEMAQGHTEILTDPLCLVNEAEPLHPALHERCVEAIRQLPSSPALSQLSPSTPLPQTADLLVFSKDTPHALATLFASIDASLRGQSRITVLYEASTAASQAGYQKMQEKYPNALFVNQTGKRFSPLCKKLLFENLFQSPYLLLAHDHLILTEAVDLQEGIELMEKTGAYAFFYAHPPHAPLPLSIPVGPVHAWAFTSGQGGWSHGSNLQLTLYRKKDLQVALAKSEMNDPQELVRAWQKRIPSQAIGLFYPRGKCVETPVVTN